MKKFILFLSLMFLMVKSEVVRNGNTFSISSASADQKTVYSWKDKDNKIYPIYKTKNGAYYILRISKKTGKEYKYYLPKELKEKL